MSIQAHQDTKDVCPTGCIPTPTVCPNPCPPVNVTTNSCANPCPDVCTALTSNHCPAFSSIFTEINSKLNTIIDHTDDIPNICNCQPCGNTVSSACCPHAIVTSGTHFSCISSNGLCVPPSGVACQAGATPHCVTEPSGLFPNQCVFIGCW